MINFCCDDIRLIENYDEAINSNEIYDCHHRLETDKHMSAKELIDNDLYYNRPASELIFLTHREHSHLHHKFQVDSIETRKKKSIAQKGHKTSMQTRTNMSLAKLGKHKIYDENGRFHYG